MSAEREVFKQIDKLVAERDEYLSGVTRKGRELIRTAVREVMLEHPEIETLNWKQDFTEERQLVGMFSILVKGETIFAFSLEESNPQLSKCLSALESKCRSLPSSLCEEYGEDKLVCVLQPEQK